LTARRVSTCAAIALSLPVVACVSTDLGYQDVRRLTSARIGKDVRWQEHESTRNANAETTKLLGKPLDADSAVQVALLNNPGLQAAFEELGVARARFVRALRLPNPTLDAAMRFRGGSSADPAIELEALIDLSELFFLPARSGVADAEAHAARLSVTGRVLDLAFQTRVSFLRYQAAAQGLGLRQSILAALRASFEVTRGLYEAGNVTDLSFASEQALYEEARIAYTEAEATLQARREELSALMGVWGRGAGWTAEARLPDPAADEPGFDQLEARAVRQSLDLELIRHRFTAAAKGANAATARGWVPELRAGVSAEREHGDDESFSIGPAVALELPLFYQGQGEAGVALAEARRQQKLHADMAVRIRSAARATAARLRAQAKSAEYYRTVLLPLRQRVVDETQLQLNAMNVGVFQLLQARRDQIEAARAYVGVLRDYWITRAHAVQLLAGRLPRIEASFEAESASDAPPESGQGAGAH
jgi:cobalt-zinc-cadmium efflux system outer membrane protein